jgi:hypothetical protein
MSQDTLNYNCENLRHSIIFFGLFNFVFDCSDSNIRELKGSSHLSNLLIQYSNMNK